MRIRKCTKTVHAGNAAIRVLPHELFAVHVASHDYWAPAEYLEVEHAVVPIHASAGAIAELALAYGKQHTTLSIVRGVARRAVGARVVNEASGGDHNA